MNLILFQEHEISAPLDRRDERAQHIVTVLGARVGEEFDVGVVNGPKGKAAILSLDDESMTLNFRWGEPDPPLDPITLVVGLSRPQTNRKVLRAAATMGVERILFPTTDRGDPSYRDSKLWTTREYESQLLKGVAQAFSTRVPMVSFGMPLDDALDHDAEARLALDNYEARTPLHETPFEAGRSVVLVVGSERGWTAQERNALRTKGYVLVSLGDRVLRTETAVVAGLALVKAAGGYWK